MSKLIDSRLIGQSIKQLRLSKNWTQDYLASVVGYSVRNLRRIENDGTSSIDVVNTFADIFQVSAISILNGVLFYIHYIFWQHFTNNIINIFLFSIINLKINVLI